MFCVGKKVGNKDDKTDSVTANAQNGDVDTVVAQEDGKIVEEVSEEVKNKIPSDSDEQSKEPEEDKKVEDDVKS